MTKESLAELIEINRSEFSTALIAPENVDFIISIADYFPSVIASVFGFECSLNNPIATADFFFRIGEKDRSNYLSANNQNILLNNYIWQNIDRFYLEWNGSNNQIYQNIKDIWLEFDLESDRKIPIPSVFFDASKIKSQAEWQFILDNIFTELLGKAIAPLSKDIFLEAIKKLINNHIPIFQVGLLLSRPNQNLRIYTSTITIEQINTCLSQLNWQGDIDFLAAILNRVSGLIDKFQLQLEIADKISSTVAIEFYCYQQQNLKTLLDYLTTTGFCLPEKREALLNFSSSDNNFSRRLAYLKMTYTPEQPLHFKAYLGITPKIR